MAVESPSATCTPRTNFSVVRVRRDILRRSNVGVIFTNRSNSPTSPDANQAYGADASFSFFQNVTANAYYARSESPELHGDEDSYQARAEYGGDRYGARLDYLDVGANFFPEIGFVQRRGFGRTFGSARFSPRMRRSRIVRRYLFEAAAEYVVNRNHRVESTSDTRPFPDRVPEQRSVRVRRQRRPGAAGAAVHRRPRRDHRSRQLPFRVNHDQLRVRPAAPGLGHAGGSQPASSTTAR